MQQFAKILIFSGIMILILGLIFYFLPKSIQIGKMPGDILIKKKNYTFYFPIVTSIIISLLISLILYIINHLRK